MRKSTGDSADPRSTGVFKAARIGDSAPPEKSRGGCRGCLTGPFRVVALLGLASLFVLTPLTALIVSGWSLQLAKRVARWRYWQLQPVAYRGDGFVAYAKTRGWLVPPWLPPLLSHWYPRRAVAPRWFGGAWRHLRVGFVCWLHSTIWWSPVIILWVAARRRGWHGGSIDPAMLDTRLLIGSIAVVVLLAGVMRILPLMQARFAFTHDWRVFYDWRTVFRLNYLDPVGGIWLAVLYGLAAHLLHSAAFLTTSLDGLWYWLAWACTLLATVASWTILRVAAVWIYPRVLRDALANDVLQLDDLHPIERQLVQTLSWPSKPRTLSLRRRLLCLGAPLLQMACWILTGLLMAVGMPQTDARSGSLAQHPLIHLPWVTPAAPSPTRWP